MLFSFPLFLITFAIYNMIAFLNARCVMDGCQGLLCVDAIGRRLGNYGGGLSHCACTGFPARRSAEGDAFLFRARSSTICCRRWSLSEALVEFLLVKQAATSVFATLLLISLVDVIGGWVVSMASARRDISGRQFTAIIILEHESFPKTGSHLRDHALTPVQTTRRFLLSLRAGKVGRGAIDARAFGRIRPPPLAARG